MRNDSNDGRGRLHLEAQVICTDCACWTQILPAAECKTKRDIIRHLRENGWREVGSAGKKRWYCDYCLRQKKEKEAKKKRSKQPRVVNQEDIPF
jgi:hypothetical protein